MQTICVPLVIAALTAFLFSSVSVRAEEGLANPGFEQGTSGWDSLGASLGATSAARSGSLALQVTSSSHEQAVNVYQWQAVQSGWSYELSAWVMANDPGIERAFVRIAWFDAGYSLLLTEDSPWVTGSSQHYRPVSTGERIAPVRAATARVSLILMAAGPFSALLDDTSLAVTPLATPVPQPTVMSTPPPAATPTPIPPGTPAPSAAPRTPVPTRTPSPTEGPQEPNVFLALMNGGFETSRDDGTAYGWRNVGGRDLVVHAPVTAGANALRLTSSTSATKWEYQAITVEPNAWLQASVWATASGGEAFLRVSWYASGDGSGTALDSDDSEPTIGDTFTRLSTGAVQVPAEAHTAKIRLMLRPASAANAEATFDEAVVSQSQPSGETPAEREGRPQNSRGRAGATSSGSELVAAAAVAPSPGAAGAGEAAGGLTNQQGDPDSPEPAAVATTDPSSWELQLLLLVLASLAGIAAILFREWIRD